MDEYNKNSHTVYDIKYHLIWVTKYRYLVLKGSVASRIRELVRQGCAARGITILQGSVGKEHIHLLTSCTPTIAPSKLMKYLKGRSLRLLQEQFSELQKKYWGQHLWARGYWIISLLEYYLMHTMRSMCSKYHKKWNISIVNKS